MILIVYRDTVGNFVAMEIIGVVLYGAVLALPIGVFIGVVAAGAKEGGAISRFFSTNFGIKLVLISLILGILIMSAIFADRGGGGTWEDSRPGIGPFEF